MQKELLTVEFRYYKEPENEDLSGHCTKVVTIGIFDTIEEAVSNGNDLLLTLSQKFEVRDKFEINGLFGCPKRLVTNVSFPTNGVQFFAHLTPLKFEDVSETMNKILDS